MSAAFIEALAIADLIALAERYKQSGHKAALADLYKNWIACHPDDPSLYAAYFNYGTVLNGAGDTFGAIIAFRESARLKPEFYKARLNLGLALEKIGQKGPAVEQWVAVTTGLASVTGETLTQKTMALENIGRVLELADQDESAEDAFRQRLELGLDEKVIQHWIALRMRQCKWPVIVASERLKRADILGGISPLSLANLADDPMFQLATAYRYNKELVGVTPRLRDVTTPAQARSRARDRLRIGYVSSDLREHAVGFSIVDLLETHDRTRFEIYAYYCGIERDDPTKARIKAAVDHWTAASALSDDAFAQQIRSDEIDILIDLNGYTKDARTKVFAHRPAPVCVNWFGFPSTMGSSFHHYIIADHHIVPEESERFYSESVMRLPCYQPNDRKRVVATTGVTRERESLPHEALVYCCLNGLQKLTEATFARWLTILAAVPGSVLWLLAGTVDTQARLRQIADTRDIAPERLVFAQKGANPDHVARYALADLFLDNLPYGAHTTAADALWMGLPVLTHPGRTFASRVCSSLVSAAGLHDLICATPDDYVARAIALGRDRKALAAIKQRLKAGRDTCLLFDTPRLARHVETLFVEMWEAFKAGALPVPDLSNLDVYHAVGMQMEIEEAEGLSDGDYRARYVETLAAWSETYPIAADRRMWRDGVEGDTTKRRSRQR